MSRSVRTRSRRTLLGALCVCLLVGAAACSRGLGPLEPVVHASKQLQAAFDGGMNRGHLDELIEHFATEIAMADTKARRFSQDSAHLETYKARLVDLRDLQAVLKAATRGFGGDLIEVEALPPGLVQKYQLKGMEGESLIDRRLIESAIIVRAHDQLKLADDAALR